MTQVYCIVSSLLHCRKSTAWSQVPSIVASLLHGLKSPALLQVYCIVSGLQGSSPSLHGSLTT